MSRQMSKANQDKKIAIEIERLNKIFADLSAEKKKVTQRLIERVAFMTITLELLEEQIKNQGAVYKFKNGKQEMIVEHPAQKSYNTMINRYTSACEKLFSLLPKEPPSTGEEEDGFEEFVNDR
ncbi:P27 family phage terminase small subunit [Halalkalibacter sp. APA_J-10(15)]|uniref:P27 family phage terminase small subunit n=1 Tax=Halalkalibacter sp. APA_J-10(15) TaxID=2933805 RepID=UPI001FF43D94|nr:P27 family phage terminase small subunit [Halalkalibacter sp. APA_J-10(15)]MCK0471404.1 hypothetical protein [Halalkalibacter sp. APA_J-10(15)]